MPAAAWNQTPETPAGDPVQRKNAPWMVVAAVLLVAAVGWWYWKNREPDQALQHKNADPTLRVGQPKADQNRPLPALPPDAIKTSPQPSAEPVPIGVQPATPEAATPPPGGQNKEQKK
jgi:hypothetical protein